MKPQMEEVDRLANLARECSFMQSFDRILSIGYHLLQASQVIGDVTEFGTFEGATAVFMTALTSKTVHVYDSFNGLPEKSPEDITAGCFVPGHLATSREKLEERFKAAGERMPIIHQGWFQDLTPEDLPSPIAFAMLDGDFFVSIHRSLELVYSRMNQGGIILIDDYGWPSLQGVRAAVDKFFANKPEKVTVPHGLHGPMQQAMIVKA